MEFENLIFMSRNGEMFQKELRKIFEEIKNSSDQERQLKIFVKKIDMVCEKFKEAFSFVTTDYFEIIPSDFYGICSLQRYFKIITSQLKTGKDTGRITEQEIWKEFLKRFEMVVEEGFEPLDLPKWGKINEKFVKELIITLDELHFDKIKELCPIPLMVFVCFDHFETHLFPNLNSLLISSKTMERNNYFHENLINHIVVNIIENYLRYNEKEMEEEVMIKFGKEITAALVDGKIIEEIEK